MSFSNLETALALRELGIPAIPAVEKTPIVAWKRYQVEIPSEADLVSWFSRGDANLAIITKGLIGFDIDDMKKAGMVLEHCGPTPVRTRTPKHGQHWIYRKVPGENVGNRVDILGVQIDIRADVKGMLLRPSSKTRDGTYVDLGTPLHALGSLDELPIASIAWAQETTRHAVQKNIENADGSSMVRRARAWLATVEGAVSGSGGHRATFRVACRLTHLPPVGFGLSFEEAEPIIAEWSNCQCDPAWTSGELAHKLKSAISKRK